MYRVILSSITNHHSNFIWDYYFICLFWSYS